MAAVVWFRATPKGRAHAEFRRWFGFGFAALAADSVVRPPFPMLSATLTMAVAGCCWALALGAAKAAARGAGDGPDLWDRRDAAAVVWWTAALSVAVALLLRLG
jgi:hypothetical protein